MEKSGNLVKKEVAIIITVIALVGGFLGGVVYSSFKTGATAVNSTQPAGQTKDTQQQTDRILALKQELAANPANVDAMIELGDIFLDSKQHMEAIAIFTQAETIAPFNLHILNDLGLLHMNIGNYEVSLSKFEAVLEIDPTHTHTLYYIGLLHRDNGYPDLALQAFEQLLSLNPDPELAETLRQEITALNSGVQQK